jgi:hypothetical protein
MFDELSDEKYDTEFLNMVRILYQTLVHYQLSYYLGYILYPVFRNSDLPKNPPNRLARFAFAAPCS